MKAYLVKCTVMTRVVVGDNASEAEIYKVAEPRLIDNIENDIEFDCVDIVEDTECPYCEQIDWVWE
jgi:hypothetical protein